MDAFFVELAKLFLPNDRLYCFFLGAFFGFTIGVSIRAITDYFRDKRARKRQAERFAREDRLRAEQEAREKQQKEDEAKRIREFAIESHKLGLYHEKEGLIGSENGLLYCPDCYSKHIISMLARNKDATRGYCTRCGFMIDMDDIE